LDLLDLLDNHLIISKTDKNGIITYANEAFSKISKFSKDELIGKSHNIVRHPSMPKEFFKKMWESLKKGEIWSGVIKNRAKDGSTYFVKTVIIPITENGEIKEYLALRQDITKIIKTQKQLAIEKTLLQKVIDNSNNIIIIKKNNKIIKVNKRFFEVFPFKSLKEFLKSKKNIYELFDDFLPEKEELKFKTGHLFKVSVIDKHNKKRIFNLFVNQFRLKKDKYAVLTLNDITEIEEEKEKAKKLEKLKSKFLANISHEIRTPLTSLLGYINLLENSDLNSTQKEYLNIMKKSGEFILEIVNSILDFSKIESGKMNLEFKENNIYEVIISTFNSLKPLAQKKGIDFILEIKNLKECYIFDSLRLKQILMNLLNNAIKFTETGYVKLEVNGLDFKVIDTGIGIEKDKLNKIFEAYLQAKEDTSRKFGGTGLGLAITKKLIEMMGGEIKVESEINKGSIFSFNLDLKECDKFRLKEKISSITLKNNKFEKEFIKFFNFLEIPITKNSNIIITTDKNLKNAILIEDEKNYLYEAYYKLYNLFSQDKQEHLSFKGKILIADDYEFNRKLIKELLKNYNITIDIAENGEEAINKALNNDYDLILMDITMPKINGLEAAKQIKAKKNTPIVAMTAHAFKNDLEKFLEVMDDYLVKPFKKEELISILKKYLKSQKLKSHILNISKKLDLSYDETKELINTFLESLKKDLPILKKAIKDKDYDTIYKEFHKIKSSSGYLGLDDLSNMSYKLMLEAKNKNDIDYNEGVKLIEESIKKLK